MIGVNGTPDWGAIFSFNLVGDGYDSIYTKGARHHVAHFYSSQGPSCLSGTHAYWDFFWG